jgi:hypothetical protein
MSGRARWGLVARLVVPLACGSAGHAAIVTETYTSRDAFATRLGGAVQTVGFDDVATDDVDPAAFASDRYAAFGLLVEGQRCTPAVNGFPADYPVSRRRTHTRWAHRGCVRRWERERVMFVSIPPGPVTGFGAVPIDPEFVSSLPCSTTRAACSQRRRSRRGRRARVPRHRHGRLRRGSRRR